MLLAEKQREIGTSASYFICFYLLLFAFEFYICSLLQVEKASQKIRERISTSKTNEAGGEQMKKGVITMAKKKI